MDSSRGGPLTTFIMMLPLIVVPALALLRPADQQGSLLHSLLSAGTRVVNGEAADSDDDSGESDPLEALFSEVSESDFDLDDAGPDVEDAEFGSSSGFDDDLFAEANGTALAENFQSSFDGAPTAPPVNSAQAPSVDLTGDPQLSQLMAQLKQMGATRTLWFSPGGQSVGFVAFFRAGNGIVSYRFEAVAASRASAVADVMAQARDWQGTQGQ